MNLGLRGDFYNGLVTHKEAEPRIGIAYNIKPSNTVLRVSYARVLETPFNENLILSSVGCSNAVLNPLLGCAPGLNAIPLTPGWRNEFHAGLEQAFGRYLVFSGSVPFATDRTTPVDLSILSADQQIQAELFCGNQFPTLTSPLTSCAPSQYGSTLVKIPAPGTENDDKKPPRIAPHHLFDLAVGHDNLFHGDRYKWSAQLTVINLTDKVALYNFLSTFSGTHYITPRSYTAQLSFNF